MKLLHTKTRESIYDTGLSLSELKKLRDATLTKEQKIKERGRLAGMKSRCYNREDKDYKYYGERGITVCEEWLRDSEKYYLFAFINGSFIKGMSIDRIDPNKGYSPENCRFIPKFRNDTVNFIRSGKSDAPNFREYRDYGFLFENQYEKKHFGDVSWHFCNKRRQSGWSLYESLKTPYGLKKDEFWRQIHSGEREFDNEIFLQRQNLKAIYPNEDMPILCPECGNEGLYLFMSSKAHVECEVCGMLHYIETT